MKRIIKCVLVCAAVLALVAPAAFAGLTPTARFALWKDEGAVDFYNLDITGDGVVDTLGVSFRVEMTPADAQGMMQSRLRLLFQARDANGDFLGELTPPFTLPTMSYPDPGNPMFQEQGAAWTYYESEYGQVNLFGDAMQRRETLAENFVDEEWLLGIGRATVVESTYIVVGISNGDGPCYSNVNTNFECVGVGTYNVFVYDASSLTMVCSRWFEAEGPLGELVDVLGGVGDYDGDGNDEFRVAWEAETSGGERFTYKNFDVATCARDGAARSFTVRSLDNIPVSNHGPTKPVPFLP